MPPHIHTQVVYRGEPNFSAPTGGVPGLMKAARPRSRPLPRWTSPAPLTGGGACGGGGSALRSNFEEELWAQEKEKNLGKLSVS